MAFRTITVIGGDLFHIAARELGDARQAVRIAEANNLVDFFLNGSVPLVLQIPAPDATAISGVADQ